MEARPAAAPTPLPPRPAIERRGDSVFWIDIAKVEPNPYQPRRSFNEAELSSLAASIREHGMLSPLLATKREVETPTGLDVRYQLIAGERRWRAAEMAGMREVPVIVRAGMTPEHEKLELALIENVQREDLNPMERAQAFGRLSDEFGLLQQEIAGRIGKSRAVVANALRLLRLPPEVQSALASQAISEGHARVILMLAGEPAKQLQLFHQIRTANLSVREAELTARSLGGDQGTRRRRGRRLDPELRAVQERLEEAFGTRVKLTKRGEQGRIIVEFSSQEELRGILDRITKREEGYV